MVTHNRDLVTAGDRVVRLVKGRVEVPEADDPEGPALGAVGWRLAQ
jgi:hypothetical protein